MDQKSSDFKAKLAIGISLFTATVAVFSIVWMASTLASQTKVAFDFVVINQTLPMRMAVAEVRIDKFDSVAKDFIRVQTRQEALYAKQAELMEGMKDMEARFNLYRERYNRDPAGR